MAIPGISDHLLASAFASSSQSVGKEKLTSSENKYFIAAAYVYISALNQVVLESWRRFAETRKQLAQESDEDHRIHQQRQAELEGQRELIEVQNQAEISEFTRCGVHRQAGKFRYHEGEYFGSTFDHRHLHIAV